MKNSFKDLVDYCTSTYANYLSSLGKEYFDKAFIHNLTKFDYVFRTKLFDSMLQKNNGSDHISTIANPCFIGFGNPDSKVLIIGAELPLDYTKKHKVLQTSVCNPYQWLAIDRNKSTQLDFDPRQPFTDEEIANNEEMLNYLMLANYLQPTLKTEKPFENCFITYMNHIPYEHTSGNNPITKIRKEVLSHHFFKSFDFVINTASFYNTFHMSEKLFGVEHRKNIVIGEKEEAQVCQYFEGHPSSYMLTNSILSSNGWTPNNIKQLTQFILANKRVTYESIKPLSTKTT